MAASRAATRCCVATLGLRPAAGVWAQCLSCAMECVCAACARTCHAGHVLTLGSTGHAVCQCGLGGACGAGGPVYAPTMPASEVQLELAQGILAFFLVAAFDPSVVRELAHFEEDGFVPVRPLLGLWRSRFPALPTPGSWLPLGPDAWRRRREGKVTWESTFFVRRPPAMEPY